MVDALAVGQTFGSWDELDRDNITAEASAHTKQFFSDLSFCLSKILINDINAKAIQTGIDAGSSAIKELEEFMNGFITKYRPKNKKDKLINRKNARQQYEDEDETTLSSDDEDFILTDLSPFNKNVVLF
ncbi:19461_t:CDS:2 [Racocetra fulgida]|uniref:19461_t:CDS:1 n=1 Tax=Racocetra fulgida TaxID=60492 RepID=A0A9N8VPR2_9GLOM|nr:19461_t:CDS:2 [Racocetra fulgida]